MGSRCLQPTSGAFGSLIFVSGLLLGLLAGCPSLLQPHDSESEVRRALAGLSREGLVLQSSPQTVHLTKLELSEIEVDGEDPPSALFHVVATGTYGEAALGYYGSEHVTFRRSGGKLLPPETWLPKLEGVLRALPGRRLRGPVDPHRRRPGRGLRAVRGGRNERSPHRRTAEDWGFLALCVRAVVTSRRMDDDPRHIVTLGKGLFEKGLYAEAEKTLGKLGDTAKNFADVQNMLGVIFHERGQFARAQRCFEQALALNPGYTEAALNLSVIYNDAGRYEDARRIYEGARASSANPSALDPFLQGKIANLYSEIGDVFAQSGQLGRAIEEYRRALELGPKFHDIRLKLAAALRDSGKRDDALKELEAMVREAPGFTPARVALGVTYYTAGQMKDAEHAWEEVLKQRPGDRVAEMYLSLLRPAREGTK